MDLSYSCHIRKDQKTKLSSKSASFFLTSALFCRERANLTVPFLLGFSLWKLSFPSICSLVTYCYEVLGTCLCGTSLLKSMNNVGNVGSRLTWVPWVRGSIKCLVGVTRLAWVRKVDKIWAWVAWVKILAWVV